MATPVSLRVKKYREHLRKLGFRPVQIWVPDTRIKGFAKECKRQSLLIKYDKQEQEILDWILSVSDDEGWV